MFNMNFARYINDDTTNSDIEEDAVSHSSHGLTNTRVAESVTNRSNSRAGSTAIRRGSRIESTNSFENISATHLLGLDDEDDNIIDDTNGAYLSYLLLRHLKIRDLRRSVKK